MAIIAGNDALASDFVSSRTGGADSGKVAKLDASGYISPHFLNHGFGGSASLGTVTISANTDYDAANAAYIRKEYDNFTINSSVTLGLINPHANGTIVHIIVRGNFTWNGKIDLKGDGASGGTGGASNESSGSNGSIGTGQLVMGSGAFEISGNTSINPTFRVWVSTAGQGGQKGSPASSSAKRAGGGGGGASKNAGSDASNGGSPINESFGRAGLGGMSVLGCSPWLDTLPFRFGYVFCGSGGGGGGRADAVTSGNGGRGGGALLIEVLGDVTIGASAEVDLRGDAATSASGSDSYGAGGGGGGGAGVGKLLYRGVLTNNGLTKTVTGGASGSGVNSSGAGGAGSDGSFDLIQDNSLV